MTAIQLADVLQILLITLAFFGIFFKLVPELQLDNFRQNMFTLRDELFDYAANGKIAFDDPAYISLREQMNRLIQYGHHITWYRVLLTRLMFKFGGGDQKEDWVALWRNDLSKIKDAQVRDELTEFHERAQFLAARRLLTASPSLMLSLFCIVILEVLKSGFTSVSQMRTSAEKRILVGPIDPEHIEKYALSPATAI